MFRANQLDAQGMITRAGIARAEASQHSHFRAG
jgi:hypothetical protein